jgi:uncharacterized membrane protein YidH (DUF202 family)
VTTDPEPANDKPDGPMWSGAAGAAAERTRLAWRRTALALTIVALLTVRLATHDRWPVLDGIVIGLAALAWIAQMWLAQRRIQAMEVSEPITAGRTLTATALAAVVFTVLGLVLLITAA